MVRCPINYNYSANRSTIDIPMRVLWSSLENERKQNASISYHLGAGSEHRDRSVLDTEIYRTHPEVLSALEEKRQLPNPLSLYVDGVSYMMNAGGRNDTVLGIWIESMLSRQRHMLCAVKQSDFCNCGCRGWCTLYPLLAAAEFMIHTCQTGVVPETDHGGVPLGCSKMYGPGKHVSRSVLVYIKADWAEWQHTFALAGHASAYSPCALCTSLQSELFDHCGECSDADGPSWTLRERE